MRNPLLALLKNLHRAVGGRGLGRIRFLKESYEFLYRLLKPRRVTVKGHVMFLDERDSLELATREVYEPVETSVLERFVTPGCLVADLGANIGYYTLLAARLTGPQGRVLAFEPDPESFKLLKRNVEANGYQNVVCHPLAVSDREGKARLYLNETNLGDHRLFDPGDGRRSVEVGTVTLDQALKNMQAGRAFIKMDVQGSEWRALDGMREFLASQPCAALVSEFWPFGLKASGGDPVRFLGTLLASGFSLYEIDEAAGCVRRAVLEDLLKKVPQDRDAYTGLLGLKGLTPDPAWDLEGA